MKKRWFGLLAVVLAGCMLFSACSPQQRSNMDISVCSSESDNAEWEFGFGAEIGISTQKLHTRGPMGLRALTSTKYTIRGNGQIRG